MHIATSLLLAAQLILGMGGEVKSLAEFAPSEDKDFGVTVYLKGAPLLDFVQKTRLIDAFIDREIKTQKKMTPEQAAMMRMQSAIQVQLVMGVAQKLTEGLLLAYMSPADLLAKAKGKEKIVLLVNLALAKEPAQEHPMLVNLHKLKEGEIDTAAFGAPTTRYGNTIVTASPPDYLSSLIGNKTQSSRIRSNAISSLDAAIGANAVYLAINNLDAFEGHQDLHKLAAADEKQFAAIINGMNKYAGDAKITMADVDKMIVDMKVFEFMTDIRSDSVVLTGVLTGKTVRYGTLFKKISDDEGVWRESYRLNGLEDMAGRVKHEARLEEKAPGYRLTMTVSMSHNDFKEFILRTADRVTDKAKKRADSASDKQEKKKQLEKIVKEQKEKEAKKKKKKKAPAGDEE